MKYNIFFAAAAIAATVCAQSCKEQNITEEIGILSERFEQYIITANCQGTKTLNDGLSTEWAEGDALSVFYTSSGEFKACRFVYEGENTFSGLVSSPDQPGDWFAVYPYSVSNTNPGKVKVNINNVPTQTGYGSTAQLAGPGFPLVGIAWGVSEEDMPDIAMKQVASACNFVVTNTDDADIAITGIEFTAPLPICGSFTADVTGDAPEWSPVEGESFNTIRLGITDGATIRKGESASFYAGLMPFKATGEFTIKVIATCNGKTVCSSKTVSDMTMDFAAGTINRISHKFAANDTVEPSAYIKVTSAPANGDWTGTYLIVNNDANRAFNTIDGGSSYVTAVTVTDGKVLSTPEVDRMAFSLVCSSSAHPTQTELLAHDVINSNGNTIFCSSNSVKINSGRKYNNNDYWSCFAWSSNGVQMMSARKKGTTYYLGYSGSAFNYTSSASTIQLYKLDSREKQTVTFAQNAFTWSVGDDATFQVGATYDMPQKATGAMTPVTYSSSDSAVASIEGNSYIKINGTGSTIITATAASDGTYMEASASYTLAIKENGVWNLESSHVHDFLDEAERKYTDDNWSTVSVVTKYATANKGGVGYDVPTPVTVSWDGYSGQQKTVVVYNDEALTKQETTVSTTASSADIYNLIPGRTYWYTVTTTAGSSVASGKFKTEGRRRQIKISDTVGNDYANNCRDLGGLKTKDGYISFGKVFRGSNMNKTSAEERAYITGYMNVAMDIDLRAPSQWGGSSTSATDVLGLGYSNAGFNSWTDLQNKDKIKETFTDIIETVTSGKACYIHCYVGADRTGYICMLLEAVLGVSQKDCSIDYEITSFSSVGIRARSGQGNVYFTQGMTYIQDYSKGSDFQEKATNILLDAGINQNQINALKDVMISKE